MAVVTAWAQNHHSIMLDPQEFSVVRKALEARREEHGCEQAGRIVEDMSKWFCPKG
jgi:hypothetical protein